MRGSKTSVIDKLRPVVYHLQKRGEKDMSLGFIHSVRGRKDAVTDIKVRKISGAVLLSCTTKRYHQEIRIYTKQSPEAIRRILRMLPHEQLRIR